MFTLRLLYKLLYIEFDSSLILFLLYFDFMVKIRNVNKNDNNKLRMYIKRLENVLFIFRYVILAGLIRRYIRPGEIICSYIVVRMYMQVCFS